MKKLVVLTVMVAISIVLIMGDFVSAHEFIVKPEKYSFKSGEKVKLSVISTHVFMVSQEIEPQAHVKLMFQGSNISLAENKEVLALEGEFKARKSGSSYIVGEREGMIWTKTTEGWKQQSKEGLKGVLSSGLYQKFCKTLVNVDRCSDDVSKPVGQKLEIVPQTNPNKLSVGDYLDVKVMFDGKPLATEVWATYDGFTKNPNTYAYYTEGSDNGVAKIKITAPGVWMVRVQKKTDAPNNPDYDKHVMRAVLVFEVK